MTFSDVTPNLVAYGMREFGIEDPDGYVILFAQRIPG